MESKKLLDGKKILIVDDEPDVLDALEELLPMCEISRAHSYDNAEKLLQSQYFDIAILDIMGVDGYNLLEIAANRNVIVVMLTAHALSVDDTVKSFKKGAASYVPKEEMSNIATYLIDTLEAKKGGESFWWRWLERLNPYYDKKFGQDWKDKDKEFWQRFPY
ncbi:MAG: response regulator [Desulfobacteraceae bacterium]|uniref:Response regulator n=1 Tax=Candidatus Desulfacyla euxinica TaxID=2841693 RepID=A0A8J6T777_9DELT|nr:response regulator [Candidatus Desulfacyla euxinica]MBL6977634.1 response regulator [Desulfobacteraceae bacterium]